VASVGPRLGRPGSGAGLSNRSAAEPVGSAAHRV